MLEELRSREKVTGVKQTRRAIRDGLARQVFLASDADPALTGPLREQCMEEGIPASAQYTMRELGQAAGIQVGAAVVALL
ncbi:MAG: 50S ribosomal protein L7ae-like protein [Oscillospiraceae bacterium]|nr:50S ribosomal protein L7ae-like protein [Oscillospiraceae bacterium]